MTAAPAPDAVESCLLVSQDGPVRVLTLNRPAALNAFTAQLLVRLRVALEEAAEDATTRAVLITGAGRAFSSGQDLSDPLVKPETGPDARPKDLGHMLEQCYIPLALRLRDMPVPVIAAVNGVAAGAGANLALSCDLVVAGESASFIQAFAKIGLIPDCGGTWLLPRLVGRAKAMELALLGDKVPAAEAQRIGLIARCVPDAELAETARLMAQRLASLPTRALVETRRAFDAALMLNHEDALKVEQRLQSQLGFAHDYQEGTAAFLAKRPPVYTDR